MTGKDLQATREISSTRSIEKDSQSINGRLVTLSATYLPKILYYIDIEYNSRLFIRMAYQYIITTAFGGKGNAVHLSYL